MLQPRLRPDFFLAAPVPARPVPLAFPPFLSACPPVDFAPLVDWPDPEEPVLDPDDFALPFVDGAPPLPALAPPAEPPPEDLPEPDPPCFPVDDLACFPGCFPDWFRCLLP